VHVVVITVVLSGEPIGNSCKTFLMSAVNFFFKLLCDTFLWKFVEYIGGKKAKEVDLYSAFIVVPHTQGAQVRITQCYLQIIPYLPLPRSIHQMAHPQTEVADI